VTGSTDGTVRLWSVPFDMIANAQRIGVWVQVITGMELDNGNAIRVLDAQTWHDRHRLLHESGGRPTEQASDKPPMAPLSDMPPGQLGSKKAHEASGPVFPRPQS
jgi:hypothetical protein